MIDFNWGFDSETEEGNGQYLKEAKNEINVEEEVKPEGQEYQ